VASLKNLLPVTFHFPPVPPYTIHLDIHPDFKKAVERRVLRAAARVALRHQAAPVPAEISIRVTTDVVLQQLNREYLGHDYATDVLSFPSAEIDPDSGAWYLGDLAIAWPRVLAQAHAGGYAPPAEAQLLVVHGVLHLLGHDHARIKDKRRMWAAQAEILKLLNAPITGPVEGEK
jgi:probable rRNA maturation factor